MKNVTVIKSGKKSDGSFWTIVTTNVNGFILRGFINTENEITDEEMEIPTVVFDAIKWQS